LKRIVERHKASFLKIFLMTVRICTFVFSSPASGNNASFYLFFKEKALKRIVERHKASFLKIFLMIVRICTFVFSSPASGNNASFYLFFKD
jgi:hypothetical protein